MSNQAFLNLFDIQKVSSSLEKGNLLKAQTALLDHYNTRVAQDWPLPPDTITDLRLNISELSQKQLIAQADSIVEFRIASDGSKPIITEDGKIEWCANPISSPEWLWRLNRHQWWPVLGLAYKQSGDERYANIFVGQLLDWIKKNPPPLKKDEKSPTWRLMEVGMRMRVSWIPAFGLFYESPKFTRDAKLAMLRSIYDHAKFLSRFKTNRNHLIRESNGLAYISIYFFEFKEAQYWKKIALLRLDEEVKKQINPDGSHIEVSTGYQWMVADELEKTYDLLNSHNLELPSENIKICLEKMYHVLSSLVRPDGTFPEINDGFIRWQYKRLANTGKKLNRKDFIFIGTNGQHGTPPRKVSIGFKDAGFYVMRSDWTKDSRYLFFDAGPYGGYHGHEDKLSIEAFAFGHPFIVDSGSYTYEKDDPFRIYFVSSHGHNTVLVDGLSQIRRWHKSNMKPKRISGNYATWISKNDFDYVAATYNEGYSSFSLKKPKNPEIIQDVIHTRHILFIKPDYWILVDEIEAQEFHNYQLLFHTSPDIETSVEKNKSVKLFAPLTAARFYLLPAQSSNLKVRILKGSIIPIQGWYSMDHHYKIPTTTVIYERQNTQSTVLATILYPTSNKNDDREIFIKSLETIDDSSLAFAINSNQGVDYLMFSRRNDLKKFGPFESRATIAFVRTNLEGDVQGQFEVGGE
jgi:hypothetical protein